MHILQDQSDESSSLSGAKIRAVTEAPEFESRKTRSATTISVISLIPTVSHGATSIFAGRSVRRNSRRVGATRRHKGVWRGFAAPKGLPKEIATQYEAAIKKIWDSAEFKEFMKADNEDNGKALKSLGLAK
jgi:hypothetical protein